MNRFVAAASGIILAAGSARAADLYVDASAPPSAGAFRRISEAVAAARLGDTIHIAPGVYTQEQPIRLGPDKSGVTLRGSTRLTRDRSELATDAIRATAAVLRPAPPRKEEEGSRVLIYVTGEDVTIRGLVFDGQLETDGIFVDGSSAPGGAIARFTIAENWFRFCRASIATRGASGTIGATPLSEGDLKGNLIGTVSEARSSSVAYELGAHWGALIGGGVDDETGEPKTTVLLRKNRFSQNFFGIQCSGDRATVPPSLAVPPVPATSARGALLVRVHDNDFVRNGGAALSLVPFFNAIFSEGDQPSLTVGDVQGNTFTRNLSCGFVVHDPVGRLRLEGEGCGPAFSMVRATLANNAFQENEINDALFSFTGLQRVLSGAAACYGHDTMYEIQGDIPSFDYDAPCCNPDEPHAGDPTASCSDPCVKPSDPCTPLCNHLTVNGELLTGQRLTPHR